MCMPQPADWSYILLYMHYAVPTNYAVTREAYTKLTANNDEGEEKDNKNGKWYKYSISMIIWQIDLAISFLCLNAEKMRRMKDELHCTNVDPKWQLTEKVSKVFVSLSIRLALSWWWR